MLAPPSTLIHAAHPEASDDWQKLASVITVALLGAGSIKQPPRTGASPVKSF
jgi:hypothetical protein